MVHCQLARRERKRWTHFQLRPRDGLSVDPFKVRADDAQDVILSTHDPNSRLPHEAVGHDSFRNDFDLHKENQNVAEPPMTRAIVEHLTERIGVQRFNLWFGETDCIRQTSSEKFRHCISVSAENGFALQRIQSTYGRDIRNVVDRVCGPHFQVEYQVKKKPSQESHSVQVTSTETQGRLFFDSEDRDEANAKKTDQRNVVDSDQRSESHGSPKSDSPSRQATRHSTESKHRKRNLKSFWFGNENRLAEASVQQLFERPGEFSPFFVYGPTGSGKTHLLDAIINEFRNKLRLRRCVMLSAEQFTSLFVSSLRGGTGLPMFRRKYRDLDLLVIDDIQFLAGKRATISEFQHTVDNLIRIGKQVIVAADRPPVELSSLGGDLGTRLTAGLSCPLRYPGLEGRVKIARQMCTERNVKLPLAVIELVCERLTRDVRRISGALNRLHALMLSTGTKITTEMAQQELCDLFSISSGNSTSMLNIETVVCEFCGVKPADLKSSSRHKQINTARMLAMYLSREYTSSAFAEIGEYFGGRSHSTVIAAQKRVNGWLETNAGVALPHATCPAKDVISRLESNLRVG